MEAPQNRVRGKTKNSGLDKKGHKQHEPKRNEMFWSLEKKIASKGGDASEEKKKEHRAGERLRRLQARRKKKKGKSKSKNQRR